MSQRARLLTLLLLASAAGPAALIAATTFTFSTLAGTPGPVVNSRDGLGTDAQFDAPRGVAADGAGNLFVADTTNNTIRRISRTGEVTTFAGTAGFGAYADGAGVEARFNEPFGLAVDRAGTIYVADASNNAIRRITPEGVVTTLAGGGGPGTTDGTGRTARLDEPRGVAVDAGGTVYVADYDNHLIRKITPAGVVTTLAGGPDEPGNADGRGAEARFRGPMGITVDRSGVVFVADSGNRAIRRISPDGDVTTLAAPGLSDPRGLVVDDEGTVYVADYRGHSVKVVSAGGRVGNLAGSRSAGAADGQGVAARFNSPTGIAWGLDGVYVADTANDTIRAVTLDGAVTTVAGMAGRTTSADGVGPDAVFEDPFSVAADVDGVVYVADSAAHIIRRISADGEVTTYAGSPGQFGSADGTGQEARFYSPFGIAVDRAGTVYVADSYNSTVRRIEPGGVVTTLAGTALTPGDVDGTGADARFDQPFGIAVGPDGNVYVSDATFNTIRRITPDGVVTTVAGRSREHGLVDGVGADARFAVPYGIAIDAAGTIYVVDHGNHAIRAVTPEGVVTTLAGTGTAGYTDGAGAEAQFTFPSGIAVNREGEIFVADTDNHAIRLVARDGTVTTVGGGGRVGSTDGDGPDASFFNPKGVAVDRDGALYVADRGNHTVRVGLPIS
ncbi:MAG: hypothetical protein AB7H88_10160 [Vicinamibacterales bacterium]